MTGTVHTAGARDIGRGAVHLGTWRATADALQRARVAVGRLPGLATADAVTILHGLSVNAGQARRVAALVAAAEYHAEAEAAAQPRDVPEDTTGHLADILAGLTPGVFPHAREVVWERLTEDAAELLLLGRHLLAGTTPKYATPYGGPPITGVQAQRAMDREMLTRRESMRQAAVRLAGLVRDDIPGGAA